jgi:hypothetical protein
VNIEVLTQAKEDLFDGYLFYGFGKRGNISRSATLFLSSLAATQA